MSGDKQSFEKLFVFPRDTDINQAKKDAFNIDGLKLRLFKSYKSENAIESFVNKIQLKSKWEIAVENKQNKLKMTYYLVSKYYYKYKDQDAPGDSQSLNVEYWFDYFFEYYYYLYFSLQDLIYQSFIIYFGLEKNESDLSSLIIKELGKKHPIFCQILKENNQSESIIKAKEYRNKYTHRCSPTQLDTGKRTVKNGEVSGALIHEKTPYSLCQLYCGAFFI